MANPWLAKAAVAAAKDPDRAMKVVIMVIIALLIFILILSAPIVALLIPNVEDEQFDEYLKAISQINDEVNILLDWQELIAIDAVRLEQDFEGITQEKIYRFHKGKFIWEEQIQVQSTCTSVNEKGETVTSTCTETKTVYHKRSLEEVMDIIGFDDDQKEHVRAFLEADMNEMLFDGLRNVVGGYHQVSNDVLRFEPLVRKYARINGIEEYVTIILAMIQQESGGRYLDVMQSSESKGWPPNTITDPEYSIEVGVSYFAERLRESRGDIKLALQSYNFGRGFINYALNKGGYSKAVAIEFSEMKARELGWARYGDINYVDNVLRYVNQGNPNFDFNAVFRIMKDLLGTPYLLGGRKPSDGGLDCSGFIEYAFAKVGINISGTAEMQYNKTIPINESDALPGDLVFFDTNIPGGREISHVGMYIGNGMFIQSSGKGVNEASLNTWRNIKDYRFLGFRRIK